MEPEPWTRIFNRVKSELPAVDIAIIRQAIFNTMVDFTADTNTWVEEIPFTVNKTTLSYPLQVTGGFPNRLLCVFRANDPNFNWADNGISMRVPGTIRLARAPSEPLNWVAAIAKACSDGTFDSSVPPLATGYPIVDAWIPDMWNDVVYYGTMWMLQRMPAKPWRDPAGAKENGALYSSGKSVARVDNMHKNVYGAQAWQFPQGFATISRKGWA